MADAQGSQSSHSRILTAPSPSEKSLTQSPEPKTLRPKSQNTLNPKPFKPLKALKPLRPLKPLKPLKALNPQKPL